VKDIYMLLVGFIIACLLLTSCAPAITPTPTSIPSTQPTGTKQPPTETPFSTDTLIAPTPTKTPTPQPPTPTPTLTPGAELITYLPAGKDWPENCAVTEFFETLTTAYGYCTLTRTFTLSINLSANGKPLTLDDLKPVQDMDPIDTPIFGQGTKAFKADDGLDIILQFFKGVILVKVELRSSKTQVSLDQVLATARQVEALIPANPVPPAALAFPDKLQKDKLKTYFNELYVTVGSPRIQNTEINKGDQVCLSENSVNPEWRSFYQAALVNLQTNQVEKKVVYQMRYTIHCSWLRPTISSKDYKAGDKYEIRVAVGDNLVAVFPLVTK
jgi:hypothetical protein